MDGARAVALACALAAPASAHRVAEPKRDQLTVGERLANVHVDYLVQGDLADTLARLFDRDRSGALDEREREQLAAHLAREATAFLTLSLDGQRIAARPIGRSALTVAAGELALAVDVTFALDLAPGDHALTVEDRHKDRALVVPVTVRLEAPLRWIDRPLPSLALGGARRVELRFRR